MRRSSNLDMTITIWGFKSDGKQTSLLFPPIPSRFLSGPNFSTVSAQGYEMMVHFMRNLREKACGLQSMLVFSSPLSCPFLRVVSDSIKAEPGVNNSVLSRDREPALGPSFTFFDDRFKAEVQGRWLTEH